MRTAVPRSTPPAPAATLAGQPLDLFTPWAKTGHAEIFTQNVNTPNGHYSDGLPVVPHRRLRHDGEQQRHRRPVRLGGVPRHRTLLTHGDPTNWTNILAQFPKTAKLANIQCENCHGPQQSDAHTHGDARATLSSDLCGSCHGEPARHGRYQQWQLSAHANYETAVE